MNRSTVLVGLVTVGVAVMAGGTLAQQEQPAGRGRGAGRGGFQSFFTGEIAVQDSSNMSMSRIRFEAGARTNWHTHTEPQILLVEEGRGRVQEEGAAVRELAVGQPFLTRPNLRHWHGAAPDQAALQFSVYAGELEWLEAVTDEQYLGGSR
jgi:quercetin dioxygenase-like cupin family protein